MKNEDLDAATELAKEVRDRIPSIMLHGDGTFRLDNASIIDPAALVTALYRARMDADKLWAILQRTPRRKTAGKGE